MRWTSALALFLVLMLAACGGGGPGTTDTDDGNVEQTDAAQTDGDGNGDGAGDGDGDGDGGGGNAGDVDAAFERLTPPNAEEVSKTTASGVIFAAFNSPDSIDSLTSFYEDAFNDLGLQILTTTEASGGVTWFVGTDENASEFGGVVSVIPATDGGSGSTVSIQIGATNQ